MSKGSPPKFHLLVLIPSEREGGTPMWHRVGVGWPTQKGDGGVSIKLSPVIDPSVLLKHRVVLAPATDYPSSKSTEFPGTKRRAPARARASDSDYAEFGATTTPWPEGDPSDDDDEIPF